MNSKKRSIQISIETAKEWYRSDNPTLYELALQAYSEKELSEPQNLKEVLNSLRIDSIDLNMKLTYKDNSRTMNFTKEINNGLSLYIKLWFVAKYFNGSWKPDIGNTKYFIGKMQSSKIPFGTIRLDNNYYIGLHEKIMFPGIVYFKNYEDVREAYKILKRELD